MLDRDNVIGLDDLPERVRVREPRLAKLRMELPDSGLSLEDVERELLIAALVKHDWNQTEGSHVPQHQPECADLPDAEFWLWSGPVQQQMPSKCGFVLAAAQTDAHAASSLQLS